MTSERLSELANRALDISRRLSFEIVIANAGNDTKKLSYLKQEAIVLRRISEILACITLTQDNDEEI